MKISNIYKHLGTFSLHIADLTISAPGIYGIIGPNGCGKTTAAKLITGLLSPDSGSIDYDGIYPSDITMLPQKPYMMNDNVHNNLVYPLKIRHIKPNATLCEEYLQKTNLIDRQKQNARSLSSGQQQKLALIRAVIFNPKLVIVDEALTDLDIDSLDMAEQLIFDIQRRNPIIWLIISHQLPHVRRLCEYIFFMASGQLETQGSTDEILVDPKNPLIQQYLKHET
jgi:ABC-type multidrug transport system ATPase subunit